MLNTYTHALNVATYSRVLFAIAGLLSILIGAPVIQDRPGTGQTPSAGKDFSLPPWVKSHDLSIDPLAHGKRTSGKPPDRSRRCAWRPRRNASKKQVRSKVFTSRSRNTLPSARISRPHSISFQGRTPLRQAAVSRSHQVTDLLHNSRQSR